MQSSWEDYIYSASEDTSMQYTLKGGIEKTSTGTEGSSKVILSSDSSLSAADVNLPSLDDPIQEYLDLPVSFQQGIGLYTAALSYYCILNVDSLFALICCRRLASLLGYDKMGDFCNRPVDSHILVQDRDRFKKAVIQGGGPVKVRMHSYKVHTKTFTWYIGSLSQSKSLRFCVLHEDISATKSVERALMRMQKMADTLPIGIYELNLDNDTLIYCNRTYRQMRAFVLGQQTKDIVLGTPIRQWMSETWYKTLKKYIQVACDTQKPQYYKLTMPWSQGRIRTVDGVSIPILESIVEEPIASKKDTRIISTTHSYNVNRVIHMVRDITEEEERAQERLALIRQLETSLNDTKLAKLQLDHVLEALPIAVMRVNVNDDDHIEYMNAHMEAMIGKKFTKIQTLKEVFDPSAAAWLHQILHRVCEQHEQISFEESMPWFEPYRLKLDSESAPGIPVMQGFAICLKRSDTDTCKESAVFCLRDVTRERRAAELHQESLVKQVAGDEASRLKSEFLVQMSHELRTPLAGIIGLLEPLLNDLQQDPMNQKTVHILKQISAATEKHFIMICNLLDYSALQAGKVHLKKSQFSLKQTVERVIAEQVQSFMQWSMRLTAPRVVLEWDSYWLERDLIFADGEHIAQVLRSLLSNALKFTRIGTIVQVQCFYCDASLLVKVKDQGKGVNEQMLANLFEPFSQSGRGYSAEHGIGLGLVLAKRWTEAMGGQMGYETQSTGSTFWFKVPIDVENEKKEMKKQESHIESSSSQKSRSIITESSHVALPPPSQLSFHAKGRHALVVDDNPLNRQIICSLLSQFHFTTELVCDGLQAVQRYLDVSRDPIHIIFMDLLMPVLDGYSATGAIRANEAMRKYSSPSLPNLPIIAVTANATQEDESKALATGMNAYLVKPLKKEHLIHILNEFL